MIETVGRRAREAIGLLAEAPVTTGLTILGGIVGGLIAPTVLELLDVQAGALGLATFLIVWIGCLFGTVVAFYWVTGRDVVDDDRAQVMGPRLFPGLAIAVILFGIVLNDVVAGTAALTFDATHAVGTLDQVALNLGRGIIAVFGIIFGSILFSEVVGRITSDTPKFENVSASEPSGSVYDIVQGLEADVDEDEARVGSDPGPIAHFDWSVDEPGPDDVHDLKRALERSGYHVHPLPNGPVGGIRDRWVWSEKILGVWDSEPDWYVRTGEDDRELVDPDLSSWQVDTT